MFLVRTHPTTNNCYDIYRIELEYHAGWEIVWLRCQKLESYSDLRSLNFEAFAAVYKLYIYIYLTVI